MPSTTFTPSIQFTPSGSNVASENPRFGAFTDRTSLYQISGILQVPANNTVMTLPIPTTWTQVTTVGIVNIDPVTSIMLNTKIAGGSPQNVFYTLQSAGTGSVANLETAGGQFWAVGMQPGYTGLTLPVDPTDWLIQTCVSNGTSSTLAAVIWYFLAGY